MAFGTLTTFDTLRSSQQSIAQYGEDLAFQAIQDALDAHNALLQEAMSEFVETTEDRQRRYGGPDNMTMEELDEFGTPDAQKISAGVTVGFPLRFYGIALQWSRLFFINATAAELAAQIVASQDADVKAVHRELKKAIFNPVNSTFNDRRIDHVNLPVKALVNADGAAIPIAPDGTTFNGATHTHFLGTATAWSGAPTAASLDADLQALEETVIEHFLSGSLLVLINRAQEGNVRAANNFVAYVDTRILAPTTAVSAKTGVLDPAQLTNRAIGVHRSAEIWVKPWVPAGWVVAMHVGGGAHALVLRRRNPASGNLELLFDNEDYPLRARALGREFGFGIWNRVAAAVLYTANATYSAPVIT